MTVAAIAARFVRSAGRAPCGMFRRVRRNPVTASRSRSSSLLVIVAALAPVIAPFDPVKNDLSNVFACAEWRALAGHRRARPRRAVAPAVRSTCLAARLGVAVTVSIVLGFPIGLMAGLRRGLSMLGFFSFPHAQLRLL